MNIFNLFKKGSIFVFDENNDTYVTTINDITFVCEQYNANYDQLAQQLANAYEKKISSIIDFMLPDIKAMFDIDDKEIIKQSLGKPQIDIQRNVITYLDHTLDQMHIIDVEFDGIFDCFYYTTIDG